MTIPPDIMEELEDQAGQLAYFDESESQILERLVHIYQAGFDNAKSN